MIVDGIDVCLEQVKAGFAWHYKKHQHEQSLEDQRLYAEAENKARDERLGLWRENNPNPPWEFRRLRPLRLSDYIIAPQVVTAPEPFSVTAR